MQKPTLFFNNILRDAQTGSDGTALASCSEAVANPDDPYKLQGDILPIADVADPAVLAGCGVVFDDTKNEYRIVDVAATSTAIQSLLGVPTGGPIGKMLVNGDYLYALNISGQATVLKVHLPTFQVSGFIFLGIENPTDIIVSFSRLDLYICGYDSTTHIAEFSRVNIASFTEVQVLVAATDTTKKLYPTAMTIGFPYRFSVPVMVCAMDASNRACVFYLETYTGELADSGANSEYMGAADSYPRDIVFYNGAVFVACRNGSNVGTIAKASAITGIYFSSLTLNSGENYAQYLLVSGSDIFAACRNGSNVAVIVKTAGGTSRTSALTLSAGETYPTNMVLSGSDIFVACKDGSGNAVLVKTSGGTSRTSAVTLSGVASDAGNYAVLYGADIYVASKPSSASDAALISLVSSGTTETETLDLPKGELKPYHAIISGTTLVVCSENTDGVGVIVRIDINTFAVISTLTLDAGELHPQFLLEYGPDIFVACRNSSDVGVIVRTDRGVYRTDALTLDAGELMPSCMLSFGSDILVACRNGSDVAVIVRTLGGTSRTDALTLNAGETWPNALVPIGTDVFVACKNGSDVGMLVKTAGGTSRTSALTLNAGELIARDAIVMGTDIMVLCWDNAGGGVGIVVQVANGTSRTGAFTLSAGELGPKRMIEYFDYIMIGCMDGANKTTIVRTTKTSRVDSFQLDSIQPYGLCSSGFKMFCAARNTADVMILHKMTALPELSLFDRLQNADIGGSFTVRAGLSCSGESELRPAPFAADCHIAPRFQAAAANAAFSILCHAPNYISDGGFESGAFSPNWYTDGGWTVTSSDELEGAYAAIWDMAASKYMSQRVYARLEKGITYTCVFKVKSKTANPTTGALSVLAVQTDSWAALDSDMTAYQPAVTTSATWKSFDVTPDFSCDDWVLSFQGDSTKKGSATGLIVDEVYFYRKNTVNTMIIDRSNFGGRGPIVVNAWKCSPLRSTATSDANNKTQVASFTPNGADAIVQSLTSSSAPVYEISIPAVAGWTPEAGEIYLGDSWQLPRFPQGFDPYETGEGGLREMKLGFTSLAPSYRTAQIERLFERLRQNEAIYVRFDADPPILMEDTDQRKSAPFDPYRVGFTRTFRERL